MNTNLLFILATALLCMQNDDTINIRFNIRNENNKCVNGALISILPYNSKNIVNMTTFCDGSAILNNTCKNIYKVVIHKPAYKTKTFFIKACNDINCNICLCRCKKNRLYGYITNQCNEIVDGAIVVLYRVIGKHVYFPVRFNYTNFTGEYNFFDIPKGCYIIKAIK